MARPLRKTTQQSRKVLLAELDRLCRQERTPNEQTIERFLQCKQQQQASAIAAAISKTESHPQEMLATPVGLLPWLH